MLASYRRNWRVGGGVCFFVKMGEIRGYFYADRAKPIKRKAEDPREG